MTEILIFIELAQIVAAIFIHYYAKRHNRRVPLATLALLILLPVLGGVFFMAVWFYRATFERELEDVFDHSSHLLENDLKYEKTVEFEKETNVVPVEEALILNDNVIKRKLIMDTVKEDAYHYIGFLKMAMADKDMETSHYAASIVMETNRKLQNIIQENAVRYEKDRTDLESLEAYTEVVGKYYSSGLLDAASQVRYGFLYSRLLGEKIKLKRYSEIVFSEKIGTDIELSNTVEILPTIELYQKQYPESEKPYLLLMKYYYQTRNLEKLKAVIKEVEGYHINYSREGQEIIKFWEELEA